MALHPRQFSSSESDNHATTTLTIDPDTIEAIFSKYEATHRPRAEEYVKGYRVFMELYTGTVAPITTQSSIINLWSTPNAKATELLKFLCRKEKAVTTPWLNFGGRPGSRNVVLGTAAVGSIGWIAIAAARRWRRI